MVFRQNNKRRKTKLLEKLYAMLDTLTNTFEEIDVKGRKNVNLMLGCMGAVDEMKLMILESIKSEKEGTEDDDLERYAPALHQISDSPCH